MGTHTAISWTDATWNPIRGCSRVSEGCRNCYAESVAARFSGPGQPYEGLATRGPARWTGAVRLVPEHIDDPLRWTKPRRIFVNSMSDLFHGKLATADIARVFDVMRAVPRHTFQVLTKRPERMLHLLAVSEPAPNIWLGVSVEDQATANVRIPLLLDTPAAVRWVSVEPQLGPVDLAAFLRPWLPGTDQRAAVGLDWVVVGGESGPHVRPFSEGWARRALVECRAAGVPVFVKQMGEAWAKANGATRDLSRSRHGADPSEWPEDLRVQEFPRG